MENARKLTLTSDVAALALLNGYNQNYFKHAGSTFDDQAVSKDFDLLVQYSNVYQKKYLKNKPVIGDCLSLPDGQIVYFCHLHHDNAQTCESGSFYLSKSGYISYSGSLDSGISLKDIDLTEDKSVLQVWFSHQGVLCGGSAIYANVECRVWKTKLGADLSGIPQVKRLRRKKLKEQSEIITKTNGNGHQYTEHLPEVIIKKKNLSDEFLQTVQQTTGLLFEEDTHYVPVYWCQPMTITQIQKLKQFSQFAIREEWDFITHAPMLVLEVKTK